MDIHTYTYTGWWLLLAPLKNDGVKVSWDDEIPNRWKVMKNSMVPVTSKSTNQLYIGKHLTIGWHDGYIAASDGYGQLLLAGFPWVHLAAADHR